MKTLLVPGKRGVSAIGALAVTFAGFSSAAEDPAVYSQLVAPLLEAKCVGCHGADKQKGKLRMDSMAALLQGGSDGKALVPGKVDDSLMLARVALPLDDDEHMPPEDKTQLTPGEIQLLRAWIEKGGNEQLKLSQLGLPKEIDATVKELLASASKTEASQAAANPAAAAAAEARRKLAEEVMKKVNATGASLVPIAQDTPELRFSALNVSDSFGDQQLAELAPVADQIAWLDIARTKVTDQGLAVIAKMTGLTKLHLENTAVGDAGMSHLAGLKKLEYLNLYKTQVGDSGLDRLKGLGSLSRLYLWQSKATPAGAERLRGSLPNLVVNLGWEHEVAKVAAVTPPAAPAPAKVAAATVPAPATPAPAPAKPATTPAPATVPTPAPAKPAATPAPAKPEPAKVAAATVPTPAPAKPAATPAPVAPAPAPAADEFAAVRQRLSSAHQEAIAMLGKSKEAVAAAEMEVRVSSDAVNKAKQNVEATTKATVEATKRVAELEAASAAIQKALDAVKPHPALADVQKTLGEDLAKASKMVEDAKQKLAAARQAEQQAPAAAAAAVTAQAAKQKALAEAQQKVPDFQAVANAIQQALDMVRL